MVRIKSKRRFKRMPDVPKSKRKPTKRVQVFRSAKPNLI